MIHIYRGSYLFFKTLVQSLSPFLSAKTKKWIQLRSSEEYLKQNIKKPLWFHASSGEIEYCKSIIREIKLLSPDQKIIISYSSPSAEKLLFNIKDKTELCFPLPWDTSAAAQKVIRHFQPQALIFSRTDFWPELIIQAQNQCIPLMAVSMFPRLNVITRSVYKWLLKDFSFITTVNESLTSALSEVLEKPVYTFSDTRFDQVFNRLSAPSKIIFADSTPQEKRMVWASTWAEDEQVLFPCLDQFIRDGYSIIIAPHEISRSKILRQYLKKHSPVLLSEIPNLLSVSLKSPVMIVDRVGYLADIYRSTFWTFVGGSFKKRIHSVMEPLAAGNCVFFGPFYANNPEATDSLQKQLTYQVGSSQDILKLVQDSQIESFKKTQNQVQDYTEKQRGSSRHIAERILKIKA